MAGKREKILIVDDERYIRMTLGEAVRTWNYTPIEAEDIGSARAVLAVEEPEIVLLDIDLPDGSGLDLLKEIKENDPDTVVVMITGNISVPNTIAALRGGAHDFIGKPVRLEELRVTLRNAFEVKQLRREVKTVRNAQRSRFDFEQIIGDSAAIARSKNLAEKVAMSDVNAILLQGETGTGKDLFARAIHYASTRADAPYLAINCAALPANLIESELFGYEKGAFTDAKQRKEGLFEQATGGTLFLDEIGEVELSLQAKLLRVLEEGTFRRVGGLRDLPLNIRVIAASNRDLKSESETGKFRLDLFFRLSVIQIDIPPLRARGGDVIRLAEHFIRSLSKESRAAMPKRLSSEAEKAFRRYSWRGNVRELRNAIERALILEDGDEITMKYLPKDLCDPRNLCGECVEHSGGDIDRYISFPPEGLPLDAVERSLIEKALVQTGGNITRAGELLGITRDRVRYFLKKAGRPG